MAANTSNSSKPVLVGGLEDTLMTWTIDAQAGLQSGFQGPAGVDEVWSILVLSNGLVAAGGEEGDIALVRLQEQDSAVVATCAGKHSGSVIHMVELPGNRFASADDAGAIQVWGGGEKGWALAASPAGHTGAVTALAALPTGQLVSGGSDGAVIVWDASSGAEVSRLALPATPCLLTPLANGSVLVGTSNSDGSVFLLDPACSSHAAQPGLNTKGGVCAAVELPDGRIAGPAHQDGAGPGVASPPWGTQSQGGNTTFPGQLRGLNSIHAVPGTNCLAGSDETGAVFLWSADSGAEVGTPWRADNEDESDGGLYIRQVALLSPPPAAPAGPVGGSKRGRVEGSAGQGEAKRAAKEE